MDKIARIRAEIERRKQSLRAGICNPDAFTRKQKLEMLVASEELDRLNRFLDTLSEEPDKSLEEEMDRFFEKMPIQEHENIFEDTYQMIARHFAKWQKEQMLKGAVEGKIYGYGDGSYELVASWLDLPKGGIYKDGDKVRIVVLKEDEE